MFISAFSQFIKGKRRKARNFFYYNTDYNLGMKIFTLWHSATNICYQSNSIDLLSINDTWTDIATSTLQYWHTQLNNIACLTPKELNSVTKKKIPFLQILLYFQFNSWSELELYEHQAPIPWHFKILFCWGKVAEFSHGLDTTLKASEKI